MQFETIIFPQSSVQASHGRIPVHQIVGNGNLIYLHREKGKRNVAGEKVNHDGTELTVQECEEGLDPATGPQCPPGDTHSPMMSLMTLGYVGLRVSLPSNSRGLNFDRWRILPCPSLLLFLSALPLTMEGCGVGAL